LATGCPGGRALLKQTGASADGQEVFDRLGMTERPVRRDRATNILVVEDKAKLRYDTVDLLEKAGYRVLKAANADEGLVLFKINQIDTLFTDIDMPRSMDGLGLVKPCMSDGPKPELS
jgi:response regulator RpfG family c-di-GMP phosphodiesterase